MRIQSSFDHLVQPSTQQAIENSCVNYGGIDSVRLTWVNENTNDSPVYDVYNSEDDIYLFSIDTDGDVTFER
jgi:hypothetical protein